MIQSVYMLLFLYLAFILSGAAGLIYESIWTRYLGLFVGHSAYAQVIVLVIFLGGMSLGAVLVGRRSERLARPLLWYAGVEVLTGLIGLVFHDVFVATTGFAYDTLFHAIGLGAAQTIAKWTIAGLLILPQSILLGMTFPLMSAGVVRRVPDRAGRALSMLYFANSLGAAGGVLIAGFWLVALAGLPGTLVAAAIINIVVGGKTLFTLPGIMLTFTGWKLSVFGMVLILIMRFRPEGLFPSDRVKEELHPEPHPGATVGGTP